MAWGFVTSESAKDLAEYFHDVEKFLQADLEDLLQIQDVGVATAMAVVKFVTDPTKVAVIRQAIADGKLLLRNQNLSAADGPLKGHKYVVSGKLTHYELVAPEKTRENFIQALQSLGATVSDVVNKETTALIIGEKPSSKLAKAKAMGIRVLTDKEAMSELLGFTLDGNS